MRSVRVVSVYSWGWYATDGRIVSMGKTSATVVGVALIEIVSKPGRKYTVIHME